MSSSPRPGIRYAVGRQKKEVFVMNGFVSTVLKSAAALPAGWTRHSRRAALARTDELKRRYIQQLRQTPPRPGRTANFPARPPQALACPYCGTWQRADRTLCWQCGAVFHFEKEAL